MSDQLLQVRYIPLVDSLVQGIQDDEDPRAVTLQRGLELVLRFLERQLGVSCHGFVVEGSESRQYFASAMRDLTQERGRQAFEIAMTRAICGVEEVR